MTDMQFIVVKIKHFKIIVRPPPQNKRFNYPKKSPDQSP